MGVGGHKRIRPSAKGGRHEKKAPMALKGKPVFFLEGGGGGRCSQSGGGRDVGS